MKNIYAELNNEPFILHETIENSSNHNSSELAFELLEKGIKSALDTYSNVHRGTGQYSEITTAIYEEARSIILHYLELDGNDYEVIFCSAWAAEIFARKIHGKKYFLISSEYIGLPLGLRVIAINRKDIPGGIPAITGGSTARMVSPNYVIWSGTPQRFEPGTPAIINAITFALALKIQQKLGKGCFNIKSHSSTDDLFYHDSLSGFSGLKMFSELQKDIMGKDLQIPTKNGFRSYINFDHAASTPAFNTVWNSVKASWKIPKHFHASYMAEARTIISRFLNASEEKFGIYFTSNTTEAINAVARVMHRKYETGFAVLNTIMEHNSNELPWRYLHGVTHIRFKVSREGFINLDELESVLKKHNSNESPVKKRIRLIAVSGASNVTGSCNNLNSLCSLAHKYDARILIDAAQLVAHKATDLNKCGADFFAFSGHKIYAPFGTGVLVVRKDAGEAEMALFARISVLAEENITGIVAVAKAIVLLQRAGMQVIEENEQILTRRLLTGLITIKGIDIMGIKDPDSPALCNKSGIVSFSSFKIMNHKDVAGRLADYGGIGIRYGCFCSHLYIKYLLKLPWIFALLQNAIINISPKISNIIPGLMRASFGIQNEIIEVDQFVNVLRDILEKRKTVAHASNKATMKNFCAERIQQTYRLSASEN